MIKLENHLGTIEISQEYFANLVGHAASECFGVSGMVFSDPTQGIRSAPQPPGCGRKRGQGENHRRPPVH